MSLDTFIQSVKDTFAPGPKKDARSNSVAPERAAINASADNDFYEIKRDLWYKAPPYAFRWRDRSGRHYYMMLPISPSNLNITTHYATNVVTSLYGTVEEHSEQRYFDIIIEGTTGMTPKYTDILEEEQLSNMKGVAKAGRGSYAESKAGINSDIAGGFFAKTIGTINAAINKATDIISGKEGLNKTGVYTGATGYLAFHRLYKFFLMYKADMVGIDPRSPDSSPDTQARTPSSNGSTAHPLLFLNYKDNCSYHCSIQRFILRKSAENPMLYQYTIILKAYNIGKIDERLGDLSSRLEDLGLGGVKNSTLLSEVKDLSNGAKQIFGAAIGGVNILGR